MAALSQRLATWFLGLVWLGVVGASVYIAITRPAQYGWWTYLVPIMATLMLAIFVTAFLPARLRRAKLSEWLGGLSTGGLILCALAVLGYALIETRAGTLTTAVLVLFFVAFARIFLDYLKHLRREARGKSDRKRARRASPDDREPDSGQGG